MSPLTMDAISLAPGSATIATPIALGVDFSALMAMSADQVIPASQAPVPAEPLEVTNLFADKFGMLTIDRVANDAPNVSRIEQQPVTAKRFVPLGSLREQQTPVPATAAGTKLIIQPVVNGLPEPVAIKPVIVDRNVPAAAAKLTAAKTPASAPRVSAEPVVAPIQPEGMQLQALENQPTDNENEATEDHSVQNSDPVRNMDTSASVPDVGAAILLSTSPETVVQPTQRRMVMQTPPGDETAVNRLAVLRSSPEQNVFAKTLEQKPMGEAAAPNPTFEKTPQPIAAIIALLADAQSKRQISEQRAVRDLPDGMIPATVQDLQTRPLISATSGQTAIDAGTQNPDRGASLFAAQVSAVARDVVSVSIERDLRFNVRPETLGPVAVTIERRDEGPALRLGVESHVAAQAVRQAEPALSDIAGRAGSPFVQVSVDLQSPGQRDRPTRAATHIRRERDVVVPSNNDQAAVTSGRFA